MRTRIEQIKRIKADQNFFQSIKYFVYSAFNPRIIKDHDIDSAKKTERILTKLNFPRQKIKKVCRAITNHRTRTKNKNNLEAAILRSFDKLDAFGPIGVYRIISPLSIRGYSVNEIVRWFLGDKRLEKKWAAIQFPELKKKYRASPTKGFTRRSAPYELSNIN